MKPLTKKQTLTAIAAALLIFGVQAALQPSHETTVQGNALTTNSSDSSDAGFGSTDSSSAEISNPDSSDATPDSITQRYNDAQRSEDRVFQGQDNYIKDEVTLENPDTG